MKSKKELIESVTRIVSGNLKGRSEFKKGTPVTPQSIAFSADIIFKAMSGAIIKKSVELGLTGPNDPNFTTAIKDDLFERVVPKANQRVHESESALNDAISKNTTTQSQLDEVVGALIEKQVVTSIATSQNIAELVSDNANFANTTQQAEGTEKKGRLSFSGKPKSRPGSTSGAPSRDASTSVSPAGTPQGTPATTRKVQESLVKSVLKSTIDPSSTASTQSRGSQAGWQSASPRASGVVPPLDLKAALNQPAKESSATQPPDNKVVVQAQKADASQPAPISSREDNNTPTPREVKEMLEDIGFEPETPREVTDMLRDIGFEDSPRDNSGTSRTASETNEPLVKKADTPVIPPKPAHLSKRSSNEASSPSTSPTTKKPLPIQPVKDASSPTTSPTTKKPLPIQPVKDASSPTTSPTISKRPLPVLPGNNANAPQSPAVTKKTTTTKLPTFVQQGVKGNAELQEKLAKRRASIEGKQGSTKKL